METNNGDVIIQPGFAPGGVGGSAYLKPKDYLILNPDNQVIFGQDGNLPVYGALIDTSNYQFNGTLFLSTPSGNTVQSNLFTTGASSTFLTGASFGYVSWINPNLVANTYGNATMDIVNYDNNTVIVSSGVSPINPNTYGTFSFGGSEVLLPSNANIIAKIYPQGNITDYGYKTWQSNALIPSNAGVIINAVVRPNNINTTHYVNVFGNVFFNDDLDTYANIVLKNIVNQDTTIITDDSIFTTGDITAQNFFGNSHQVSGNITGDYFIGNNMILSQTGQAQFFKATNSVILDPQGAPITNPANALSNSGGQLYFNGNVIAGGGVGGVSQIIAGNGIEISPLIGTGNVIVSLAGSVIPPGGYLPIAGGTMTGSIYQFPSSNLVASNTIKKYRPLTSYQPPFPSISTPSFTGEQLTFFNGDNSPEQLNFTGWFPENMFQWQPDVITGNIPGGPNTFYSFTGGTNQAITGGSFATYLNQFANGDHITGGFITIVSADADQTKCTFSIFSQDPGGAYNTLYQTSIPSFPTAGGTYNFPIDYTYTGGQTGQNILNISFDPKEDGGYPNFTMVATSLGGIIYNFQGQLTLAGVGQSSHYIGVQADATFSGFYEYFPTTNLLSKLGGVFKTSGIAKINGIYTDDVATSRSIIVYGDFNGLVASSGTTYTFNNIFMFNVDTGAYNALTTQTADPAYAGNLPKGLNGAVYGVEKQSSQVFSRKVWIWGDFTNVAQMGNPLPPTDSTVSCGINYTQSDNWAVAISWGFTSPNNSLNGCRGGSIADDNPLSPQSFALMVWATTRDGGNYRTISIAYYDTPGGGGINSTLYPFGNGNFGNPAITTNVVSRIEKVDFRTGPSTVYSELVFCGKYIGSAQGAGSVDVPCYSLSSTQQTNNGWSPSFTPIWQNPLIVLADSGNASLWYPNSILMGSYTYRVCTNGTINETAVIGTTGYSSLSTNGGGVLTMNNSQFITPSPTVNQFLITGVPAYSVKNVIGIDPTAINLSCSLDEDNFWYGQTFNSTISPTPTPPTIPTVVAINGARFLVNNVEMDKIVFSGGETDFSSVSFIAGSVEKGDPHWYWQSQVGALDYFAGNVFYPNITSSPASLPGPTTDTWGNVLINGNIASKDIDMNNFNIINANTITPIAGNDLNIVVSGNGSTHITQSSTGGASQPILEIENTNAGANGSQMDFYKNSSSPAIDDTIGAISLYANNASATKVEYARISGTQRQITAGSENGSISVFCCSNSPTPTEMIRFNGDGQTGTGSIDTYKPFNISTNTIIGSSGSINLVSGLFTSILNATNLRIQDTTTTTTQTQISKTALTVAILGINTVYGSTSIITTGSTNLAITNTSFAINLTSNGINLNAGASPISITQTVATATQLTTNQSGHKFYPDYVLDNQGLNTVVAPNPSIINERLTIINYGLTQNNVWAPYGDSQGNGVNFIFRDSQARVWVANDTGNINIRDDTLNSPDLQTIQVGGGNSQVYVIYEASNYVYIGGNFSNVSGNAQLQYSISRFDISSFPYSFSPLYGGSPLREGVQGDVYAIADIGSGNLIIGGNFTLLSDSTACNYICIITGAQSSPSSQTFAEYAGGTNGSINALLLDVSYNYLWVGGAFTSVQGGAFTRNYCSAYHVINNTWDEVATNLLNNFVNCITLTNFGQIFLAGDFPALTSGQNYNTYIDRTNPAVWNDTNLGGVPQFSQRNLATYDGSNMAVFNSGGVWVNTSQLVWVFIENPTTAVVPATGTPLCITIWSGLWKVGLSTTAKVYSHIILPDSCNFTGNFKYGVGVHTTATLTNENTSQQFIGDPTCAFWIPIGTPICSFS